jgi:predicted nucleic acid-binding Zn ribbon protein
MTEAAKICLECGDAISGRRDKKFCSDQCRTSFNNNLNTDSTKYMRNVMNALRKNRRILVELNKTGKTKVHLEKLASKGFNFQYHTSTYTNKKGQTYYFCFENGYMALEDDYYILVQNVIS